MQVLLRNHLHSAIFRIPSTLALLPWTAKSGRCLACLLRSSQTGIQLLRRHLLTLHLLSFSVVQLKPPNSTVFSSVSVRISWLRFKVAKQQTSIVGNLRFEWHCFADLFQIRMDFVVVEILISAAICSLSSTCTL